jgi:hypothetical protein
MKLVFAVVATLTVAPLDVVIVMVLPDTAVTWPVTCVRASSIDPAVVGLVGEDSTLTCSPTASRLALAVASPARTVVEASMAYVTVVPLAVVTVIDVGETALIVPSLEVWATVVVVAGALMVTEAAIVGFDEETLKVTVSPTARSLMAPAVVPLVTLVEELSEYVTLPEAPLIVIEVDVTAVTTPWTVVEATVVDVVVVTWSWLRRDDE